MPRFTLVAAALAVCMSFSATADTTKETPQLVNFTSVPYALTAEVPKIEIAKPATAADSKFLTIPEVTSKPEGLEYNILKVQEYRTEIGYDLQDLLGRLIVLNKLKGAGQATGDLDAYLAVAEDINKQTSLYVLGRYKGVDSEGREISNKNDQGIIAASKIAYDKLDNRIAVNSVNLATMKNQVDNQVSDPRIAKYAMANLEKYPKRFTFNGKRGWQEATAANPLGDQFYCGVTEMLRYHFDHATHLRVQCYTNVTASAAQPMYLAFMGTFAKTDGALDTIVTMVDNGHMFSNITSYAYYHNMSLEEISQLKDLLGNPSTAKLSSLSVAGLPVVVNKSTVRVVTPETDIKVTTTTVSDNPFDALQQSATAGVNSNASANATSNAAGENGATVVIKDSSNNTVDVKN